MASGQRKVFKVTILGDGGVGKTSLRKIFMGEDFKKEGYSMTVGADFNVKEVSQGGQEYVVQIWDLAEQMRFSAVKEVYYQSTSGCLLVFDISLYSSFASIPSWIAELLSNNSNKIVPMILIGNKTDLRISGKDQVSEMQAEDYAEKLTGWNRYPVPYIETCATSGLNVHEAFETLFENITKFYGTDSGLAPIQKSPGDDMGSSPATLGRRYKD